MTVLNKKNQTDAKNSSIRLTSGSGNELLTLSHGKAVTTSRTIAKVFGKNHQHVLRDIKNLGCSEEFGLSNFGQSYYDNRQGKQQPQYLITRDGFVMLAMGYTGDNAMKFKEAYIAQFNEMEMKLHTQLMPAETNGIFKGLVPMMHDGRKAYLYSHVLTALQYSKISGSRDRRIKKNPNHFFRVYGRVMVSAEYANYLHANKELEHARLAMQLSLNFNPEGGAL